jgi:ElaB/YqjD/DUF883 family membrane-anchored ribosome-binding protein
MTKRKKPEERSATAMPQPGQSPAKPTGGEVFRATQKPSMAGPAHLPESADEVPLKEPEAAEVETLLTTANEYYERLTEAAGRLSEHATDAYDSGRLLIRDHPASSLVGAFAVGVIVGLLSNRR